MDTVDYPPSPRIIAPTPHDSAEQHMRWLLLDMHRYQWQATGCRPIRDINELTQAIRKEWLEQRKAAR